MPTFHKSDSPEWGALIVGVALTDAGRLTPTVGSTLCWQSTQNGWLWPRKVTCLSLVACLSRLPSILVDAVDYFNDATMLSVSRLQAFTNSSRTRLGFQCQTEPIEVPSLRNKQLLGFQTLV